MKSRNACHFWVFMLLAALSWPMEVLSHACPLLAAKMAGIQNRHGSDFGPKVYFSSITVDPERDTADVLKRYAEAHKAKAAGWAFLTGTPNEIREVAKRYGIYYKKTPRGDVDHTSDFACRPERNASRAVYGSQV